MNNKYNKFYPAIPFLFALVNVAYPLYLWARCLSTQSVFYCGYFEFPFIVFLYGIPAFFLTLMTILSWMTNEKLGRVVRITLLVVAIIIFVFPWVVVINGIIREGGPFTYSQYLIKSENDRNNAILEKQKECELYKKYLAGGEKGEKPLLTIIPATCY